MASSNSNMLKYINLLTDSKSIKFERDNGNAVHDSNIQFAVIDLYFG
jgi:hypothetical protein